ncbi:MAG: TetR/AcrR family transcriptional regulator [Acidimicrobiales bacterium]
MTASNQPRQRRAPGRPRSDDAVDTRRRVLRVAQEQFGEQGYAAVSMDQLAAAVGVNVRSIYHYFPSKRALFDAAAAAAYEAYGQEVIKRVWVHPDLRSRLHGFVDVHRTMYREQRFLSAFLSVVMTETIATKRQSPADPGPAERALAVEPILVLNGMLADEAIARGELADGIDRDVAIALLHLVGMGIGLAALDETSDLTAVLDALDLLIDGTLLTGP